MHHLDLGLFKYQVEYTRDLIKEWCGLNGVNEFDNRLGRIPRFPGLKLFKNGLNNIKRFTADEFRAMMRQLVFVIDGIIILLHKTDYTVNQAKNMDKQLVQVYVNWNKMYIFSRKDEFTDSDLKTFEVSIYLIIYIFVYDKITFLIHL
jgi:intracellular sulfur oxidation DsrE/DsrF family protein